MADLGTKIAKKGHKTQAKMEKEITKVEKKTNVNTAMNQYVWNWQCQRDEREREREKPT